MPTEFAEACSWMNSGLKSDVLNHSCRKDASCALRFFFSDVLFLSYYHLAGLPLRFRNKQLAVNSVS